MIKMQPITIKINKKAGLLFRPKKIISSFSALNGKSIGYLAHKSSFAKKKKASIYPNQKKKGN